MIARALRNGNRGLGLTARGFVVVVLAGLFGLSTNSYWEDWQNELAQVESLAKVSANGAAEQIGGSLRTIDLLIQSVGRSTGGGTVASDIETTLGVSLGTVPEMQRLIMTNADGQILGAGLNTEPVGDRDFFILQKDMYQERSVVFDGPRVNPNTGRVEVVLSRPLRDAAGGFNGVIAAVLRSDYFANPLMTANLEHRASALLFNVNGVIFNRFPETSGAIGLVIPGIWIAKVGRRPEGGAFRDADMGGDHEAIIAYKAVRNYPLTVAVGISVAAVFDDWLRKVMPRLVIDGVIGVLLIGFASLFDIGERNRRRIGMEVAALNVELEQRVEDRTVSLRQEISDRIRAERETLRLEAAYRDLFDGAQEGLAICRGLSLTLINQSFSKMFGILDLDRPKIFIADLVAGHCRAKLLHLAEMALNEGRPALLEVEGLAPAGTECWFQTSLRRVIWEDEAALQMAFIDITATKRAKQQMLEAKLAAERANELKSRFLAVASHDLRQPAQAIALYANVQCKRARGTELAEIADHLAASSDALSRLLDSLLDISKLESGSIKPHHQALTLRPLLEHLWTRFSEIAEESGISFSVVSTELAVDSDPVLLDRILQNLLSNAIRYTPRGGKVLLGCRRQGGRVGISVLDNGQGISIDERDGIFLEFYRSATTAQKAERGLGLGLSIVHRLVQLLGHELALDSELGRGSVFTLWLKVAATPAVVMTAPLSASADAARVTGCRILLIDDDAQVRDSMVLQLRDWGILVLAVASGDAAVRAVSGGFRPQLLVVDRSLGGGETGLQALMGVEDILGPQRLPVIMLTGDTAPAELASGGWGYCTLHKPVHPEHLLRVISVELAAAQQPIS